MNLPQTSTQTSNFQQTEGAGKTLDADLRQRVSDDKLTNAIFELSCQSLTTERHGFESISEILLRVIEPLMPHEGENNEQVHEQETTRQGSEEARR